MKKIVVGGDLKDISFYECNCSASYPRNEIQWAFFLNRNNYDEISTPVKVDTASSSSQESSTINVRPERTRNLGGLIDLDLWQESQEGCLHGCSGGVDENGRCNRCGCPI